MVCQTVYHGGHHRVIREVTINTGSVIIGVSNTALSHLLMYFAWVKEILADAAVLPEGKTADGLKYSLNQEKYLKAFLDVPDVPIDNSASERVIRTFCLGKKNWVFHNTVNGASSSALVYSISETAKLNDLRPYYYFRYIITELSKHCDEKDNIDPAELDYLMPWSESFPEECRKPRRS